MIDLGTFAGDFTSRGLGINNVGQVTGYSSFFQRTLYSEGTKFCCRKIFQCSTKTSYRRSNGSYNYHFLFFHFSQIIV